MHKYHDIPHDFKVGKDFFPAVCILIGKCSRIIRWKVAHLFLTDHLPVQTFTQLSCPGVLKRHIFSLQHPASLPLQTIPLSVSLDSFIHTGEGSNGWQPPGGGPQRELGGAPGRPRRPPGRARRQPPARAYSGTPAEVHAAPRWRRPARHLGEGATSGFDLAVRYISLQLDLICPHLCHTNFC